MALRIQLQALFWYPYSSTDFAHWLQACSHASAEVANNVAKNANYGIGHEHKQCCLVLEREKGRDGAGAGTGLL